MTPRPWYLDAIFYQVSARTFYDADGDGYGDFRGLTAKLSYIRDLGADCLWLMPHYLSPRRDDGYDVADCYRVDPACGTLEDFDNLVAACHGQGLRIVTDFVLNHVSSDHPWFEAARRDPESPYRDFFVWSDTGCEYGEAPIIFSEVKTSNWTYDEAAGRYYWHRFFSHQPDLNYDNPAVGEEMLRAARFWLERGVDGFRVDAVPYLYERQGTTCENLPETHAFCRRLRRLIDEDFPAAVLLGESNQPYETLLPYLDGELHLGFHFPLMPRLFLALAAERARPVIESLAGQPPLPSGTGLVTFLRNHDELTLEKVSEEERELMVRVYSPGQDKHVNRGIPRRLAPLLGNDRRKIELLYAVVLGLDQPVCLYYGDEIGMGDDLSLPDRFKVRTPMQWEAGPGGGFSTAERTCQPMISDAVYGFERVNVAQARATADSLFHRVRELIALRKGSEAIRRGSLELLEAPARLLAFRRHVQEETVTAIYNFSGQSQALPPSWKTAGNVYGGSLCEGRLAPFGWVWLTQECDVRHH